MVNYLVYAIQTCFGQTGTNEFGFIQKPFILLARKIGNRWTETFVDPRSAIFSQSEHIRSFRTHENAQRWIEQHVVTIGGEKPSSFKIVKHYGQL